LSGASTGETQPELISRLLDQNKPYQIDLDKFEKVANEVKEMTEQEQLNLRE
jgi:hypothetical protein